MIEVPGILVLYHAPFTGRASTIMEHVEAFGEYSAFPVVNVNTDLGFPQQLRRFRFQAIVLHYSLFAPIGYYLNVGFLEYLSAHRDRYRIAFFQDEHHYCGQRFAFLNDHAIDSVYSMLQPQHVSMVYGRYTRVPHVAYSIPGYVTAELEAMARRPTKPDHARTVDVGYRGRKLPAYMGRGAQEKYDIAIEFQRRASGRGLKLDIEAEETSRIYGGGWFEFIENCRAVLGVESGVSVFDLDDQVRLGYQRLMVENPGLNFEQISEALLQPYEGVIPYRTISPRHFEAAALGTSQILYEGDYSGLMQPWEHYIPLKKDHSNFEDVLRIFADTSSRMQIARRAKRDLIESGQYTYKAFVAGFDRDLRAAGLVPPSASYDRSVIDQALHRGHLARRARRRLRHVRHVQFPGRELLKPIVKPVISRFSGGLENPGSA